MEFRTYASLEEMATAMQKATERANRDLASAQREVTWGSHWVRFYLDKDTIKDGPLVIFGRVLTEVEMVHDEDDETIAFMRAQHDRGYMFSRSYSVLVPEGELGDTHRANLWPCSQALFLMAQKAGWNHRELPQVGSISLVDIYTNYRAHLRAVLERSER